MINYLPLQTSDQKDGLAQKILNETDSSVKTVGKLFIDLGFEPIAHKRTVLGTGEIDLGFKLQRDGYLVSLILEVSKHSYDQNRKIDHFFSRWSAPSNLKSLLRDLHVPGGKNVRLFVDMSRDSKDADLGSVQHHLKDPELGNRVLFKDDIEYFQTTLASIGRWAKSDLLSYLRVPTSQTSVKKEAIQFYLEDVPVFCFISDVRTLLDSCYISRRLGDRKGYQRALNESRLKDIGREIEDRKVMAFPNSIIINCEENLTEVLVSRQECPKPVEIHLPTAFCSCCVVDGQHRLLGFSRISEAELPQRHLPVVAFQKLPHDMEVKLFTDINSKQKRIDSNLIQDLKADFDWDPTLNFREHTEKLIVLIARQLNGKGPLRDRIYFGGARETRKEKITLSTFVSVLKDDQLLGGSSHFWQSDPMSLDITEPMKRTKEFFSSLLGIFAGQQGAVRFLLGNVGMRIVFRTVQVLERNNKAGVVRIDRDVFLQDLKDILIEDLISELQTLYGAGGKVEGSKRIVKEFKNRFPERYKALEIDFRRLPSHHPGHV